MALFYHELVQVKPGQMRAYWEAFAQHSLPRADRSRFQPLGMWRAELRHTEMIYLFASPDWPAWVSRHQENDQNPTRRRWLYETGAAFRDNWVDTFLAPAPFSPDPAAILVDPAMQGSLYLHRTLRLRPGQIERYQRLVTEHLRPRFAGAGFTLVGCWQATGGTGLSGTVIHLWNLVNWPSWAAYQERAASVAQRALAEEEREMAFSVVDRLLQPAPFSPLGGTTRSQTEGR